jgi:D-alanyl-lipoteichoic acid acyltransferase DltB (MBOAT superfamily)
VVQIYCDFSAYSDMAIGIAALLGYRFPRNFDRPYRSASLQEFWRRWHISLSRWLRDYLYIEALGGSRGGKFRLYRNLMITMLLGGLWHGAAWTFVIWGGLHGAALVIERVWATSPRTRGIVLPHWVKVVLTFHVVTLGWIFFRAASFGDALAYLGGIVAPATGAVTVTPLILVLIVFGLAIHALRWDSMTRLAERLRGLPAPALAGAVVAAMLVVDAMRFEGIAPFIYFRF